MEKPRKRTAFSLSSAFHEENLKFRRKKEKMNNDFQNKRRKHFDEKNLKKWDFLDNSASQAEKFISDLNGCTTQFTGKPKIKLPTAVTSFSEATVLGRGPNDTIVYQWEFEGNHFAVKSLNSAFMNWEDCKKILNSFMSCDDHINLIKYFAMEKNDHSCFLVMELCHMTLDIWLNTSPSLEHKTNMAQQTLSGLVHLHSQKIVHGSMKPSNILVKAEANGNMCFKLTDYGLSRKIKLGKEFQVGTAIGNGTLGWISPESLKYLDMDEKGKEDCESYPSDVFALGCIFYYSLSNGKHPFGKGVRIPWNISEGKYDISEISKSPLLVEHADLITMMIDGDTERRIKAGAALEHLVFWSSEEKLKLLIETNNRLSFARFISEQFQQLVENIIPQCPNASKRGWLSLTCDSVKDYLQRSRPQLNGSILVDLLSVIRDMSVSFDELPIHVKIAVGNPPEKFLTYWTSRVPLLILRIWAKTMEYGRRFTTRADEKNALMLSENKWDKKYTAVSSLNLMRTAQNEMSEYNLLSPVLNKLPGRMKTCCLQTRTLPNRHYLLRSAVLKQNVK